MNKKIGIYTVGSKVFKDFEESLVSDLFSDSNRKTKINEEQPVKVYKIGDN